MWQRGEVLEWFLAALCGRVHVHLVDKQVADLLAGVARRSPGIDRWGWSGRGQAIRLSPPAVGGVR